MTPLTVVKVLHEAPKYKGVDMVVRLVEVDGERMVDIRDRIDSDDTYQWGRGFLMPVGLASEVVDALLTLTDKDRGEAA